MRTVQGICVANAMLWMSALDSDTFLPQIIVLVSGAIALVIEKRKTPKQLETISVSNDYGRAI